MIVNIVNITFVVSPVSLYSSEVYVQYRVPRTPSKHDHKLQTLCLSVSGRVRTGPSVQAVPGQSISNMIGCVGEAVI